MIYPIGAAVCFFILLIIDAYQYDWSFDNVNCMDEIPAVILHLVLSILAWYIILPVLLAIFIARLIKGYW